MKFGYTLTEVQKGRLERGSFITNYSAAPEGYRITKVVLVSRAGLVRWWLVKAAREHAARSQRIGDLSRARTMLLTIAFLFATAAAGPVLYDQRQDGKFNAQVDISNVMVLFAIPSKIPNSVFDIFSKSGKPANEEHEGIQDRADVRVMEAFVEPSKPYKVEIGSDESSGESDGRAVEVVIAGRRRFGNDGPDAEQDDLKLLGATENCGPDRVRDSVTLMCKDIEPVKVISDSEVKKEADQKVLILEVQPAPAPEVISS
ncbi:unnamed protein product [Arctia plantaginis]|uniref:Uncharacterized protein n=1 Tax=Arctia plantaginis TaxID=874455 RepID=A0A8S0ZPQ2_ARCPL|nr:unnamed protein product [Arctia plantaginis]CAB3235050.1 unnamed protein product [Arctia plantaginis]